jgi:hypothetical protein
MHVQMHSVGGCGIAGSGFIGRGGKDISLFTKGHKQGNRECVLFTVHIHDKMDCKAVGSSANCFEMISSDSCKPHRGVSLFRTRYYK